MSKAYKTHNTPLHSPAFSRPFGLSNRIHHNSIETEVPISPQLSSNLTTFDIKNDAYSLQSHVKLNNITSQANYAYNNSAVRKSSAIPSACNSQLYSVTTRREHPSRKPADKEQKLSRKPDLQLNLGEIDMGIDEFPEGPRTLDQRKFSNSQTPLESPSVKTLRGLKEGIRAVIPIYSVKAGTGKPKKIVFPGENNGVGKDKENSLKVFFSTEYVHPKLKNRTAATNVVMLEQKARRAFLESDVLGKVTEFLDCKDILSFKRVLHEFRNEKRYQQIFNQRIFSRILRGLDEKDQYNFWDALVDFGRVRATYPSGFTSKFVKECSYLKDISKDLDRTLPEYDKYSTPQGKESLLRVLVAISNTVKDVGYIQGLNSIVGVFLFNLNDEKSYWITLYMMEKLNIKNILREDFNAVHILNYQFKVFLDNYVPDVANYLNKASVDISYYTTPWFITLFSYFLTLPNTVKAWNFLFIKGNSFLIQLGLAVFSRYKNKIMNMDADDLGTFFKYELREISSQDDHFFEEALQFHVSDRLMAELEGYYKKGKPQLQLIKDFFNKFQWKLATTIPSSTDVRENPKAQLSSSVRKESRMEYSPDTRKLTSPNSALSKGKELVQSLVQSITIDLPVALKDIFVRSSGSQNVSKLNNSENSQVSTQGSLPSGLAAGIQSVDDNYDLKPGAGAEPMMLSSMEVILTKEHRRGKCNTDRKPKKDVCNKAINLTDIRTDLEEEDDAWTRQAATTNRVRLSKEVALVEMKNNLMYRKRPNQGINQSKLTVDGLQSPRMEDGYFSPRSYRRANK